MAEREVPISDDLSNNLDLNELKNNAERKRFCLALISELFVDSDIVQIQLAGIDDWQAKLPELAKGLPPFKDSALDLVVVIGPNVVADEKDWSNGSNDNGVADETDSEAEELDLPPSYCETKFYFGNDVDNISEIDEDNPDAKLALFLDDRYLEIWTMAQEKPNMFVERKSSKKKGNAQRLKMLAEVLLYTKSRMEEKS